MANFFHANLPRAMLSHLRSKTRWKTKTTILAHFSSQNPPRNTANEVEFPLDKEDYASILLNSALKDASNKLAKTVHAHTIHRGMQPIYIQTKLLNFYVKRGDYDSASKLFEEIPDPNIICWTMMLGLCTKMGFNEEAIQYLIKMKLNQTPPDPIAIGTVLPLCSKLNYHVLGRLLHKESIVYGYEGNSFVGCALVDFYDKAGALETSRFVFERLEEPNAVVWTMMISSYARNGEPEEALRLFYSMKNRGFVASEFTYVVVLPACASLMAVNNGMEIHQEIVKNGYMGNVFVGSALLDMYVKCGNVDDARNVFDEMPTANTVSMNSMIAGYSQNGMVDLALELFNSMSERDNYTWTSMIMGLARNGRVDEASSLFLSMPEKNVVSWNSMIAGFQQNQCFDKSLEIFKEMQRMGFKPNCDTFSSVLSCCANLTELGYGRQIHANIVSSSLMSNIFMGSALVDMYAKCGDIGEAKKVFDRMSRHNVVSWNALICGYATHGQGKVALEFFEEMLASGCSPNYVSFIGVLYACCHAGLVDEGWKFFNAMTTEFGIVPKIDHYCCMVDLLGRVGRLQEAKDFVDRMPIPPNEVVLSSLVSACKIHNNMEIGEQVADRLIALSPSGSAHYIQLSNLYASAGRWDGVEKVRKVMRDRNVVKNPGFSWVEVNGHMTTFRVGDRSHAQTEEIYVKLESLVSEIKAEGYIPDTSCVLHDVDEEQKMSMILHHSEKLAIAFALIKTPQETPIRIVKNLRVCPDCHTASKYISKVVSREIIMRDSSRFHHFVNGSCSCGDFW